MDDTLQSYIYAMAKLSFEPESVVRFSPVVDSKKEIYVIDPFSVRNIRLNTGLEEDDIQNAFSALGFSGEIKSSEIKRSDEGVEYSIIYDRYETEKAPEAMQHIPHYAASQAMTLLERWL